MKQKEKKILNYYKNNPFKTAKEIAEKLNSRRIKVYEVLRKNNIPSTKIRNKIIKTIRNIEEIPFKFKRKKGISDSILATIESNPFLTVSELVKEYNTTATYIYSILSKNDIDLDQLKNKKYKELKEKYNLEEVFK